MNVFRAAARFLYLVFYTTYIVSKIVIGCYFAGFDTNWALRVRQQWARHLLWAIGVKIVQEGTLPEAPCLMMCNHRAYLDPIIILHDVLAWPVSKAEVAKWPVLGYGAKMSGILYLKRESMTSRKQTLAGIAEIIQKGWPVILFPEGTTNAGRLTGAFKRGGFQLAASEQIPVLPIALHFGSEKDYWVGKDLFIPHFFRRFSQKNVFVRIRYGFPILSGDAGELLQKNTKLD